MSAVEVDFDRENCPYKPCPIKAEYKKLVEHKKQCIFKPVELTEEEKQEESRKKMEAIRAKRAKKPQPNNPQHPPVGGAAN